MGLVGVEVAQLARVHHDEVGVVERERDLLVHQRGQRGLGVRLPRRRTARPPLEQPFADVGEHRREQRLLALEVPVDGGAAHTDRGADVVDAGGAVAALGEQASGGLEDLIGALARPPPNERSAHQLPELPPPPPPPEKPPEKPPPKPLLDHCSTAAWCGGVPAAGVGE